MNNNDYTKFSAKKVEETTNVEVDDISTPEPPEEPKYGVVTDCVRLNVRKEPDRESAVICEVNAKVELVIVESESTDEFYKVLMPAGVEGFCMKRYITIIP